MLQTNNNNSGSSTRVSLGQRLHGRGRFAVVLWLAFAAGCGDDGPCSDPTDASCTITADAANIHVYVFSRSCAFSSCHGAPSPKEDLDLSSLESFLESTIDKDSTQDPSRKLIDPGNPSNSYLLNKLRGQGITAKSADGTRTGRQMPPNGAQIHPNVVRQIEAWIAAGAPRG